MTTTAAHWRLIAGRLPISPEGDALARRIAGSVDRLRSGTAASIELDDTERELVRETNARIPREHFRAITRYNRVAPL